MERMLLGAGIGAVLGFLYQRVVGCASGACPLTANPYISALYGAALGLMMSTR